MLIIILILWFNKLNQYPFTYFVSILQQDDFYWVIQLFHNVQTPNCTKKIHVSNQIIFIFNHFLCAIQPSPKNFSKSFMQMSKQSVWLIKCIHIRCGKVAKKCAFYCHLPYCKHFKDTSWLVLVHTEKQNSISKQSKSSKRILRNTHTLI